MSLLEPKYTLHTGDALEVLRTMPDESVQMCVTSPPYYGLRDYGNVNQIGLEPSPEAYVAKLVEVFREVRRVLRDDGCVFLNLGDSYAGSGNGSCDYREDGASISKNDNKYGKHKPGKGNIKMRLRKDLTPKQLSYVLTELAKAYMILEPTQDGLE